MVSAFGSPTDDRAPGRQRNRRLHLAAVAAGLVFVVAGAAAAAPHLLKTTDTRSVVPSATSTLAVAQSGGIGPQTTSEEPAGTSSRVGGDASSPPTTPADATVPEPATTQPDADVVARCVDRGLGASTSSTIHDGAPAGSSSTSSAPTTTLPLCGQPADNGQPAVASTAPGQAQAGTHDSDRRRTPRRGGSANRGRARIRRRTPRRGGSANRGRARIRRRTPLLAGSIGLRLTKRPLPTPCTVRNSPIRQPPRQTPRTTTPSLARTTRKRNRTTSPCQPHTWVIHASKAGNDDARHRDETIHAQIRAPARKISVAGRATCNAVRTPVDIRGNQVTRHVCRLEGSSAANERLPERSGLETGDSDIRRPPRRPRDVCRDRRSRLVAVGVRHRQSDAVPRSRGEPSRPATSARGVVRFASWAVARRGRQGVKPSDLTGGRAAHDVDSPRQRTTETEGRRRT